MIYFDVIKYFQFTSANGSYWPLSAKCKSSIKNQLKIYNKSSSHIDNDNQSCSSFRPQDTGKHLIKLLPYIA